jgi:hypothetical protein
MAAFPRKALPMKSTRISLSLFVLTLSASFLLAQPTPKKKSGFVPGCPLPAPLAGIAEPQPIDKTCSIRGFSKVVEKVAESRAKNNFCAPGPPVDISYDAFKELQKAVEDAHVHLDDREHPARPSGTFATSAGTLGEGNQVRFVAFVLKAKYSNTKKRSDGSVGENVNCNQPKGSNNDVHIVLVPSLDNDEEESVTAEAIPHKRPSDWTPGNLNQFHDHLFRFTGQLFLDSSHGVCSPTDTKCGPKRVSVWEIHPVYAIEICTSKKAGKCKPDQDAGWEPLDEFVGGSEPGGGL